MVDHEPEEVELKLAATADAMDTLLASPLLREHATQHGPLPQSGHHLLRYRDQRLSRRGLAFRVRQTGKKFIQTLKTAAPASGVETARGEWEVELPDSTPQLTAFNDPPCSILTGLVLPDELVADLRDQVQAPGGAGRVARRQPASRRRSRSRSIAAPSAPTAAKCRSARSSWS